MTLVFKIIEGLCKDFNAHIFAVLVVLVFVQLWIYHKSSVRATGCSGRMDLIENDVENNNNRLTKRIDITDKKVDRHGEKINTLDKSVSILEEKYGRTKHVEG